MPRRPMTKGYLLSKLGGKVGLLERLDEFAGTPDIVLKAGRLFIESIPGDDATELSAEQVYQLGLTILDSHGYESKCLNVICHLLNDYFAAAYEDFYFVLKRCHKAKLPFVAFKQITDDCVDNHSWAALREKFDYIQDDTILREYYELLFKHPHIGDHQSHCNRLEQAIVFLKEVAASSESRLIANESDQQTPPAEIVEDLISSLARFSYRGYTDVQDENLLLGAHHTNDILNALRYLQNAGLCTIKRCRHFISVLLQTPVKATPDQQDNCKEIFRAIQLLADEGILNEFSYNRIVSAAPYRWSKAEILVYLATAKIPQTEYENLVGTTVEADNAWTRPEYDELSVLPGLHLLIREMAQNNLLTVDNIRQLASKLLQKIRFSITLFLVRTKFSANPMPMRLTQPSFSALMAGEEATIAFDNMLATLHSYFSEKGCDLTPMSAIVTSDYSGIPADAPWYKIYLDHLPIIHLSDLPRFMQDDQACVDSSRPRLPIQDFLEEYFNQTENLLRTSFILKQHLLLTTGSDTLWQKIKQNNSKGFSNDTLVKAVACGRFTVAEVLGKRGVTFEFMHLVFPSAALNIFAAHDGAALEQVIKYPNDRLRSLIGDNSNNFHTVLLSANQTLPPQKKVAFARRVYEIVNNDPTLLDSNCLGPLLFQLANLDGTVAKLMSNQRIFRRFHLLLSLSPENHAVLREKYAFWKVHVKTPSLFLASCLIDLGRGISPDKMTILDDLESELPNMTNDMLLEFKNVIRSFIGKSAGNKQEEQCQSLLRSWFIQPLRTLNWVSFDGYVLQRRREGKKDLTQISRDVVEASFNGILQSEEKNLKAYVVSKLKWGRNSYTHHPFSILFSSDETPDDTSINNKIRAAYLYFLDQSENSQFPEDTQMTNIMKALGWEYQGRICPHRLLVSSNLLAVVQELTIPAINKVFVAAVKDCLKKVFEEYPCSAKDLAARLVQSLKNDFWNVAGVGFWGVKVPDTIEKLRKLIEQPQFADLKNVDCPESTSILFIKQALQIVMSALEINRFSRHPKLQQFYQIIVDEGLGILKLNKETFRQQMFDQLALRGEPFQDEEREELPWKTL